MPGYFELTGCRGRLLPIAFVPTGSAADGRRAGVQPSHCSLHAVCAGNIPTWTEEFFS